MKNKKNKLKLAIIIIALLTICIINIIYNNNSLKQCKKLHNKAFCTEAIKDLNR